MLMPTGPRGFVAITKYARGLSWGREQAPAQGYRSGISFMNGHAKDMDMSLRNEHKLSPQ